MTAFEPPARRAGTISGVDLDRLDRLAECLLRTLSCGLSWGFVGTLGAGKTQLTQSIASHLGIDRHAVTSPTFTLLHTYDVDHAQGAAASAKRLAPASGSPAFQSLQRIHHLDAYRLTDEDEFWALGVEELFEDRMAWTIVEWADKVASEMPADTTWMRLGFEDHSPLRCVELFSDLPDVHAALRDVSRSLRAEP